MYADSEYFENILSNGRYSFTGVYFKVCHYFAHVRLSDFQLHNNFLMVVSPTQKVQQRLFHHKNGIIKTITPL